MMRVHDLKDVESTEFSYWQNVPSFVYPITKIWLVTKFGYFSMSTFMSKHY